MMISLIAAVAENNAIGGNGDLLWRLPADLKYFKETTQGHCVLMGRKTYDSIPAKFRPLPYRTNIIVSRDNEYKQKDCHVFSNIQHAIDFAEQLGEVELFVIGGGTIYKELMEKADKLYITEVHAKFEADTFFPEIKPSHFQEVKRQDRKANDNNDFDHSFVIYERISG